MKRVALALHLALIAGLSYGQGIDTPANKNDWEEINFDYDSAVLVDGFPSLLRLAELLQATPGARVRVQGFTDALGSEEYNVGLGLRRANAVRDFLVKYGAAAAQISASSGGETAPRAPGQGTVYRPTDEARYMNRRVVLTVTDAQGNAIGAAGGAGDAIRAINSAAGNPATAAQLQSCCDQVLKRLDKLDEIANMLKDLADQNAQLKREVDALRNAQQAMQTALNGAAGRGGAAGPQGLQGAAGPQGPQGAAGPQGPQGAAGPQGPQGAAGAAGAAGPGGGNAIAQVGPAGAAGQPGGRGGANGAAGPGGAAGAAGQAGPGGTAGGQSVAGTTGATGAAGNAGAPGTRFPTAEEIARALRDQGGLPGIPGGGSGGGTGRPSLQLLGANIGADDRGEISFTGRARFFAPFGAEGSTAFQAQGEYYYLRGQREAQIDFGLVNRFAKRGQIGLFGSFKNVSLTGNQSSGTLGQASVVADYLFSRGKIGLFASKGFLDNALIHRTNAIGDNGLAQRNIILERYLKVVDQVGVASTIGLIGNTYAEANVGYLRSTASSNRVGGSLRLILPVNDKFAFTVEGGVNETFLPLKGTQQGRAAVGIQLGNFIRPKEYLGTSTAIPMEVPRVRYETLERRIRVGNDPPVADAGGDLTNVSAGTVALDGSNSYDPDGDPITYQWIQEQGPSVSIANAAAARASFTAALGQVYVFRLTVRDDQGSQATARVRVTTKPGDEVQILYFLADPKTVPSNQSSALQWSVLNATSVVIDQGVGQVPFTGSRIVNPAQTTTYMLTAKNDISEKTISVTVAVSGGRFNSCFASPGSIRPGESATLNWITTGATGVTISGIGPAAASGSINVSPAQDTNYILTTAGAGPNDTCSIAVRVLPGEKPQVLRFSATPTTIETDEETMLVWNVFNADKVTISGIGDVPLSGQRLVKPGITTTYTLTASNASGSSSLPIVVTVFNVPPPQILSFTATPLSTPGPGAKVQLTCNTVGSARTQIGQAQFFGQVSSYPVFPAVTTTYTCVAINSKGQSVEQSLTVTVGNGPPQL